MAVPAGDHEGGHRPFHQRGPVPHHVDVVGRQQRRPRSGRPAVRRFGQPEPEQQRRRASRGPRRPAAPARRRRRSLRTTGTRGAVNTGAMNIGFHASRRHAPNSALLRALCTHAPSSCQTMPTVDSHGGSAAGKRPRRTAATSRCERRDRECRRDRSPATAPVASWRSVGASRSEAGRPGRIVIRAQPVGEQRLAHEERRPSRRRRAPSRGPAAQRLPAAAVRDRAAARRRP